MRGADIAFLGVLVALLAGIAYIDLAERRIPDRLNLALGAVGLARALYMAPAAGTLVLAVGSAALTGAVVIATARWAWRFPSEGMGWGDIKFLLAAAFWVGFDGSIVVLMVAGIVALAGILVVRPWRRITFAQPIAFGPMLAIGLFVVVAAGIGHCDRPACDRPAPLAGAGQRHSRPLTGRVRGS